MNLKKGVPQTIKGILLEMLREFMQQNK